MIKREQRINIYERDGNKCIKCGSMENLTIDHIIPLSEGGTHYHTNLQTLCWDCNQKKASVTPFTFWQKIKRIWILPEMFANFKNSIQGAVVRETFENKRNIQAESSKYQSMLDRKIVAQDLILKDYDKTILENRKVIKEQEQVILMLVDYLGIEAVPSKIIKPYFRQKEVIPLTDLS